jgi:hypothetical protein
LGPDKKGSVIWGGSKRCNILTGTRINKDKKLMWAALLFTDDNGPMGGGKVDIMEESCHRQMELLNEL